MNFSRRTNWAAGTNRITLAIEARRRAGYEILDLTETNPTRVGLEYPDDELASILGRSSRARYAPESLGLSSARESLAANIRAAGFEIDPGRIVLTASTSEAYSFLFRLLCDPGDSVLTGVPSYPLLDHLTALDSVRLLQFQFRWHGRWEPDLLSLAETLEERSRALVAVHPNNPTGTYLDPTEQDALAAVAREKKMALVSDEVFFDFPLMDGVSRALPAFLREDVLAFSLGGLSKSAGLPHWKLGWILVGGPEDLRRRALAGLELIADTFLSVSTPVQAALPEVLRVAPSIRDSITARTRANLAALREALGFLPAVEVLPVEGGWMAVVRIPRTCTDEELVIDLLERSGVVVQPGYLFDFARDGFLVLSLLPPLDRFREGVARLAAYLAGRTEEMDIPLD
ncbi:MAG: pyridoxal phosphate-dependent aminotransferase [Thermoanaerobaculia bacterium]